ncbi:hypothetical protein ACLB2K_037191 [Fragaria x ananassa]
MKLRDEDEEDMDHEDGDGEIEDDDDDEDSEDDEHEETVEMFLKGETALALENGSVIEEGDIEDEDLEMDFEKGCLEEIDLQEAVTSLLQKCHPILIKKRRHIHQSSFQDL